MSNKIVCDACLKCGPTVERNQPFNSRVGDLTVVITAAFGDGSDTHLCLGCAQQAIVYMGTLIQRYSNTAPASSEGEEGKQ